MKKKYSWLSTLLPVRKRNTHDMIHFFSGKGHSCPWALFRRIVFLRHQGVFICKRRSVSLWVFSAAGRHYLDKIGKNLRTKGQFPIDFCLGKKLIFVKWKIIRKKILQAKKIIKENIFFRVLGHLLHKKPFSKPVEFLTLEKKSLGSVG